MDTKKLRQKILDLAIHGKLVPQDPNDEPASVLLERIKAEKERLIKEGKIKRSRKAKETTDTPYYTDNVPFEVPNSWVWTNINSISKSILYGVSESAKTHGEYKLLRITDIQENIVYWNSVPYTDYDSEKASLYLLKNNDILFARTGATVGKSYLVTDLKEKAIFASYLIRVQSFDIVRSQYIKFFFESGYYWQQIADNSVGTGQPNVNGTILGNLKIPIAPLKEQDRIIIEVKKWFSLIDLLEKEQTDLKEAIKHTKAKVLDLAIHGKLVPQDDNDEPAIELLKRINPKAGITCDNGHYKKLPDGWIYCKLEDIVEYEQPKAYLVNSTDYDDSYYTPVLTAGKSFILGYTNETSGLCSNLPVIIFDDFTTESKYVDFEFKVKSSAMKILRVKEGIDINYVYRFMSRTRLISDTHKRYWISQYSKLLIPLPPINEQKRITQKIEDVFLLLDTVSESL